MGGEEDPFWTSAAAESFCRISRGRGGGWGNGDITVVIL